MVRSATERVYLPARSAMEEIGDMMILTGRTIVSALRAP
jgi:phospholipid/cholesterol/gamma-HCH transport system permease protein